MWAFAVSKDGLGLDEESFWQLTPAEHNALVARFLMARGIKPEPTPEEIARTLFLHNEWNKAMIRGRCRAQEKRKKDIEERRKQRRGR